MPGKNGSNRIRLPRNYPEDPRKRYTRSPEAIGGDAEDVDAAIAEPVRIMNDVLGFKTYASCEGHMDPTNPHATVKPGMDEAAPAGEPFASYIGFYLPISDHIPLVDFLCDRGFFAAVGGYYALGRTTGNTGRKTYAKYDDGTVLTYGNDGRLAGDRFLIRVGVEPRDMLYDQEEWDRLRDKGWEAWLNLLDRFKRSCRKYG